jgi:raffinose/stachyose/melibiose transport system permease protein
MTIPFETVLFTLSGVTKVFQLNNPIGAIIIYTGFAIPLNVFIYSIFIKRIPVNIEEAAFIEGCSAISVFSKIIFPSLKKISLALLLLNTVWIWNNFLIADIVLGPEYKTIPAIIETLGASAARNNAILTAVLLMSLLPSILFYRWFSKLIIKRVQ